MKRNWTSRATLVALAATTLAAAATAPAGAALKAPSGAACTITGTPGDDVLHGTPGDDVLCGLGGDDVIQGHAGDDVLAGGAGADALYGGAGRDRLHGGEGADRFPRDGADTIADRSRADLVGDYDESIRVNVRGFTGQTITLSQGPWSNCTRDENYGPVRIGGDESLVLRMTVKNTGGCALQPSNNSWAFALPGGGRGVVNVQRPVLGKPYEASCVNPWTGASCTRVGTRVTITAG